MFVTACERTINTGEFHGLHIGDDRANVLRVLQERGVESVRPDVADRTIVKGADADFGKLQQRSPLCITNNAGLAITLEFDKSAVLVAMNKSAATREDELGLAVGQPRAEVFRRLKAELAVDKALLVGACLPTARWIDLDRTSLSKSDIEYLMAFEAWRYDEPGSYSSARLIFSGERLSSIVFFWRPVELP
jgi:hypothetical protein